MTTEVERISRLGGAYQHLATKADVAELKGELKAEIHLMEIRLLRWGMATVLASVGVASGVTLAVDRLLGS